MFLFFFAMEVTWKDIIIFKLFSDIIFRMVTDAISTANQPSVTNAYIYSSNIFCDQLSNASTLNRTQYEIGSSLISFLFNFRKVSIKITIEKSYGLCVRIVSFPERYFLVSSTFLDTEKVNKVFRRILRNCVYCIGIQSRKFLLLVLRTKS